MGRKGDRGCEVSYTACIASLKTTLGAVSGVRKVLNGRPTAAQNWPLVYLWADRGERAAPMGSQVTVNTYYVTATLCVPFQDNYVAEDGIGAYLNSIPAAIDANPTLTSACNVAYVVDWRGDVREIGEVQCRVVDFTVLIRDKSTYQGGN